MPVKFYLDVNGWLRYQWRRNIAENFNRLSRAHERYRRQADRWTVDSVSERLLKRVDTRCSAIAERPRCSVRYSSRQK